MNKSLDDLKWAVLIARKAIEDAEDAWDSKKAELNKEYLMAYTAYFNQQQEGE